MISKKGDLPKKAENTQPIAPQDLIKDLRSMIEKTRQTVASTINASLSSLYWHIGRRIHQEVLKEQRAEYGREIVATVSRQLALEYGKGFNDKYLRKMIQFSEVFPDEQIVASLMRQLTWTHFLRLIPIKDLIKRDFYAEMCRVERWTIKNASELKSFAF